MSNERYQVLYAPKQAGVSVKEAQDALAVEYPAYEVEVFEQDDELVAKLTRKKAADDEEPKGKIPPFLDEKEEKPSPDGDEDEGGPEKPKAPKAPGDDEGDDDEEGDGEDAPNKEDVDPGDDDEKGGDDLSKALKALETLKHVLPKLEKQLKGDLGDGIGAGDDGGPVPPPPGIGGPEGPGGPLDKSKIGPTPGSPVPPGPGGPGGPGAGAPPPPPLGGPGGRVPPRPQVGVPTFSNVKQNKFVYRPAIDPDGTQVSLAQATEEISGHPKYAAYDLQDIRLDDESKQIVAHLKLRKN